MNNRGRSTQHRPMALRQRLDRLRPRPLSALFLLATLPLAGAAGNVGGGLEETGGTSETGGRSGTGGRTMRGNGGAGATEPDAAVAPAPDAAPAGSGGSAPPPADA